MHLQECVDAPVSIAAACRAADTASYSLDTSSTLSIHRSRSERMMSRQRSSRSVGSRATRKRKTEAGPKQDRSRSDGNRRTEAEWFT